MITLNLIVFNVFNYCYWRLTTKHIKSSGYVCHRQAEIHYVCYGTGKPVVLLHGGLSNKLSWFSQIPMLVKSGREVILIDTRGHAKSTFGKDKLSYQLFAEDVSKVLKNLSIHKVDIIGWSDGGITALVLAQWSPAQVNRVIAISANISPTGLTEASQHQLMQKGSTLSQWIKKYWTGSKNYLHKLEQQIWHIWSVPVMSDIDFSQIDIPILIIVGDSDVVTQAHSEKMVSLLKNSYLKVITNGGHATPVTHAREINTLINDFLVNPSFQ